MSDRSLLIIIDGYNLIMTCGFVTPGQIPPGKLKVARNRLIRLLERKLPEPTARRTRIVFDTRLDSASKTKESDTIQVDYSYGYNSADEQIMELVRKNSVPKKLLVVSSDHQVQVAARSRDASFIDSDEWFFEKLGVVRNEQAAATPSDEELMKSDRKSVSDSETAIWAELFSEESKPTQAESREDSTEKKEEDKKVWNPFPDDYADDLFEE